jgi:hypothetical protein
MPVRQNGLFLHVPEILLVQPWGNDAGEMLTGDAVQVWGKLGDIV